jgi:hypothetical protein
MDGFPARAAVQAVTIEPPSLLRRSVDPIVHTEPSRHDASHPAMIFPATRNPTPNDESSKAYL